MDASAWFRLLLVLVVLQGGYEWWQDRAVTVQGGVVAPAEPLQVLLEDAAAVPHGRWQLTPRARYDITGRVALGRSDRGAARLQGGLPLRAQPGEGVQDVARGFGFRGGPDEGRESARGRAFTARRGRCREWAQPHAALARKFQDGVRSQRG
jgi:hypothetical protein